MAWTDSYIIESELQKYYELLSSHVELTPLKNQVGGARCYFPNILNTAISLYDPFFVGTQDIFSCLKQLRGKLNAAEERDELSFLTSLFQNPQFQQAVNIHRKMISVTTQSPPPKPEATDAFKTSNEVMEELQNAQSPYSSDLLEMLSTPGFRVSEYVKHLGEGLYRHCLLPNLFEKSKQIVLIKLPVHLNKYYPQLFHVSCIGNYNIFNNICYYKLFSYLYIHSFIYEKLLY